MLEPKKMSPVEGSPQITLGPSLCAEVCQDKALHRRFVYVSAEPVSRAADNAQAFLRHAERVSCRLLQSKGVVQGVTSGGGGGEGERPQAPPWLQPGRRDHALQHQRSCHQLLCQHTMDVMTAEQE